MLRFSVSLLFLSALSLPENPYETTFLVLRVVSKWNGQEGCTDMAPIYLAQNLILMAECFCLAPTLEEESEVDQ